MHSSSSSSSFCRRLKVLDITGVQLATDASLVRIVNNLHSLVELSISKTKATDATVSGMSGRLPKLRSLNMIACEEVTTEAVLALIQGAASPATLSIDLTACRSMTPSPEFIEAAAGLAECVFPDTTPKWTEKK